MDSLIRNDHDRIEITYLRLSPTNLYPTPGTVICIEVKGIDEELVLKNLNDRNLFEFKKCKLSQITITFTAKNENTNAKNESAAELKKMGSSAKGGNTLLGLLLLSSIQTEVPVVKAAGTVIMKSKSSEVSIPFESEFFDSHYVKSESNKDGKIDLEVEALKLVSHTIWGNIEPGWKKEYKTLSFEIKKPYYEDFKWALHHEEYHKALILINELMQTNKESDLYYNRGVLYEYSGNYEQALTDYQLSKELGVSSVERMKSEISYKNKINQMNKKLYSSR